MSSSLFPQEERKAQLGLGESCCRSREMDDTPLHTHTPTPRGLRCPVQVMDGTRVMGEGKKNNLETEIYV